MLILCSIQIVIIIVEDIHGSKSNKNSISSVIKRKRNVCRLEAYLKSIPWMHKKIPPNKKQRTVMTKENRQNFIDTDRGSYYNQEKWLEEFLEVKGIFYNDNDSDSETYDNESLSDGDDELEEVCESFNNNILKILSPLLLQE